MKDCSSSSLHNRIFNYVSSNLMTDLRTSPLNNALCWFQDDVLVFYDNVLIYGSMPYILKKLQHVVLKMMLSINFCHRYLHVSWKWLYKTTLKQHAVICVLHVVFFTNSSYFMQLLRYGWF